MVTPSFNSADYIEETLVSVLSQVTDGEIFYHVQDGGSADQTLEILERWSMLINKKNLFSTNSRRLNFSFTSQSDAGMYDAINKGFDHLSAQPTDVMTWINSDDRLPQGAFATVAHILQDVPTCRFLSGRISLLTSEGAITGVSSAHFYTQADLAGGLHDGRQLPFIMQEGTFFTGDLWLEVGGVDPKFRLAGDWDLWRRMARQAEHFSIDTVTGFHRRRPGQLSEDMGAYYKEVDAHPSDIADRHYCKHANLVRYQSKKDSWLVAHVDPRTTQPFTFDASAWSESSVVCRFGAGFGPPEGPYPEFGLPADVRWVTAHQGTIHINAPGVDRFSVRARVRPTFQRPIIEFFIGLRIVYRRELPSPKSMVDQIVEFPCWLDSGDNELEIQLRDADNINSLPTERALLVVKIEIATDRSHSWRRTSSLLAASTARPSLSNVTFFISDGDHAERLEATLMSLIVAGAPQRSIFVTSTNGSIAQHVAERYQPFVAECGESHDLSYGDAYVRPWRIDLKSGDRLAPHAMAIIHDLIAGKEFDSLTALADVLALDGSLAFRQIISGFAWRAQDAGTVTTQAVVGAALLQRPIETQPTSAGHAPRIIISQNQEHQGEPVLLNIAKSLALTGCSVSLNRADSPTKTLSSDSISIVLGKQSITGVIRKSRTFVAMDFAKGAVFSAEIPEPAQATGVSIRAQARKIFALDVDCFTIVLFNTSRPEMEAIFQDLGEIPKSRKVSVIWCGTSVEKQNVMPYATVDVRNTFDTRTQLLAIAAADVVLDVAGSGTGLEAAIAIAEVPLLSGETYREKLPILASTSPMTTSEEATKAKCRAISRNSIEAFAVAFLQRAAHFVPPGPILSWLEAQRELSSGGLRIETDRLELLHDKTSCSLIPIEGAKWLKTMRLDGVETVVMSCRRGGVTLLAIEVRVSDVYALKLCLSTEKDAKVQIFVDEIYGISDRLSAASMRELTIEAPLGIGLHRVRIIESSKGVNNKLGVVEAEVVAAPSSRKDVVPTPNFFFGVFCGREAENPRFDGDWSRLEGFFDLDDAHPQFGLHEAFRWSARWFSVALWSSSAGLRSVVAVTRGNHAGQMLRPTLNDVQYAWCEPLPGSLSFPCMRSWTVRLNKGRNIIHFEASSVSGSKSSRELGIILDQIYFGSQHHDDYTLRSGDEVYHHPISHSRG